VELNELTPAGPMGTSDGVKPAGGVYDVGVTIAPETTQMFVPVTA
jgi:hypothetical protein